MRECQHISLFIARPPREVYDFVSNPANLPHWASGLSGSIDNIDGKWIADSPMGKVEVRFAAANDLGVLDHDVVLESGDTFHNPMRVVPNDEGAEVVFTLFRQDNMDEAKFAEDATWVAEDLLRLKALLEK